MMVPNMSLNMWFHPLYRGFLGWLGAWLKIDVLRNNNGGIMGINVMYLGDQVDNLRCGLCLEIPTYVGYYSVSDKATYSEHVNRRIPTTLCFTVPKWPSKSQKTRHVWPLTTQNFPAVLLARGPLVSVGETTILADDEPQYCEILWVEPMIVRCWPDVLAKVLTQMLHGKVRKLESLWPGPVKSTISHKLP